MNVDEFDRLLRHTLSDYRLSRGEKRVLKQSLKQLNADEHDKAVLRSRAFDLAREAADEDERRDVLEWLEEVIKVLAEPVAESAPRPCEAYFTPGDNAPRKIANLFAAARQGVDICVFTITDDRIADAIVQAHSRRVQVRIISDDEKALDRGSDIDRLRHVGVDVRVDRSEHHMHHKFAVFDNVTVMTGSYNWTRSAAQHNAENFVLSSDPQLAREFSREFQRLWDEFA